MPMPKKRSDEKLGRPHTAQGNPQNVDKIEFEADLTVPEANPEWCYIAVQAWDTVVNHPARDFFADSDLIYGWMTCQAIHEAFVSGAAMKITAADSMMRAGLFNEADRRRAQIEITRKAPAANPTVEDNIAQFRKRREATA